MQDVVVKEIESNNKEYISVKADTCSCFGCAFFSKLDYDCELGEYFDEVCSGMGNYIFKEKTTMDRETIFKEELVRLYENSDNDTKDKLKDLFGKMLFLKDVTERIKTFEDAVDELGSEHPLVKTYNKIKDVDDKNLQAYSKLRIIAAALNEGWLPPQDSKTHVWYCWHCLYTKSGIDTMDCDERKKRSLIQITGKYNTPYFGFGFSSSIYAPSNADAHVGSHLCFKSEELADYCGRQFIELWADYKLI